MARNIASEKIPEEVIEIIAKAKNIVAFSGAGISAESGIPTFRDKGGLWDRFNPEEVGTTGGLLSLLTKSPERILAFLKESFDTIRNAMPNPGHRALFELEKLKLLKTVITQNIDNLHTEAGNTQVIELHGNLYRMRCIRCGKRLKYSKGEFFKLADEILNLEHFNLENIIAKVPRCDCGGIMRIDVVFFGEAVHDMDIAYEEARKADVMIIVGTSGVVYPAASVPLVARRGGAKIIEINPTISGFGDIVDWWIEGYSSSVLKNIIERIKDYLKSTQPIS